jgi:hypothetical protein
MSSKSYNVKIAGDGKTLEEEKQCLLGMSYLVVAHAPRTINHEDYLELIGDR